MSDFGQTYNLPQGGGTHLEPIRKHMWKVIIATFDTPLLCQVTGVPKWAAEKLSIRHGNNVTHYLGRPECNDLRLEIIDVMDPDIIGQFFGWWTKHADMTSGIIHFTGDYKRQGQLLQFDSMGNLFRTWIAQGIFMLESPGDENLDANTSEKSTFPINLAVDRMWLAGFEGGATLGGAATTPSSAIGTQSIA